jgi:hypothetical protein
MASVLVIALMFSGAESEICDHPEDAGKNSCSTGNVIFVALWQAGKFVKENHETIEAISTLLIAIFTITLWNSTRNLWDETRKGGITARRAANAAARSADAARASADSLRSLERAWMMMNKFKLLGLPPTGGSTIVIPDPNPPRVRFSWKNTGRSAAFVLARQAEVYIVSAQEKFPEEWPPFMEEAEPLNHEAAIVKGGRLHTTEYLSFVQFSPAEWKRLTDEEEFIIFRAYIKYRDIFDVEHESFFCAKFTRLAEGELKWFQHAGGKNYNRNT